MWLRGISYAVCTCLDISISCGSHAMIYSDEHLQTGVKSSHCVHRRSTSQGLYYCWKRISKSSAKTLAVVSKR
jgi:hypothetical protein